VKMGEYQLSSYPAYNPLERNAEVVLEAVSAPGYRFDNWSGAISTSTNIVSIKANKDKMVTANFSRIIPNWLIAIITAAITIPLLLRWRVARSKQDIPKDVANNP